jgi:hypothetical protein
MTKLPRGKTKECSEETVTDDQKEMEPSQPMDSVVSETELISAIRYEYLDFKKQRMPA